MLGVVVAQQPASSTETAATFDAATAAQRKAAELAAGAAGADPAYIQMMEEFASMPHADLYAKAQQMQPGVLSQVAERWETISTSLTANMIGLNAKVNGTIARGWEGQTGEAILAATRAMTELLSEVQNVAQGVGYRVHAVAHGAEVVKAQIQPPPTSSTGPLIPGAENPIDAIDAAKAASDAWQAAIWTMRNNYVPTYEPAGQDVPVFPTATGLGHNDIPGGTGTTGTPVSGGPGAGNDSGTESETASTPNSVQPGPGGDSVGAGSAEQGTGSGDGASSGAQSEGTGTTAAAAGQPAAGTPTASQPGAPTGSGSPNVGGPGVGGPGTGGTGVPVGSPGGQAGRGPGPGGALRGGTPGSGSTPAQVGGSGVRAAGAHGMPGMAGAPGAARQGKKDDDEHHGRSELLMHPRNRHDLVGPPQGTVPPVIGAVPERPARSDRERR
ncbi:hypothetical protein ACFVVM_07585 [Nocardia sp. NPDC058176]|uniref:hypothetical protein n=1 Tax=Nocardia sp. NPDC058176 TaxID=3346368 RepID=UPI0036DBD79F